MSGTPTEEEIDKLRGGIHLPPETSRAGTMGGTLPGMPRRTQSEHTLPARIDLVRQQDNPWYEVTLTEGRNRQIRRMFEQIGHHVEKIKRVRYGTLRSGCGTRQVALFEAARGRSAAQSQAAARRPAPATGERGRAVELSASRKAFTVPSRTARGRAPWLPAGRADSSFPPRAEASITRTAAVADRDGIACTSLWPPCQAALDRKIAGSLVRIRISNRPESRRPERPFKLRREFGSTRDRPSRQSPHAEALIAEGRPERDPSTSCGAPADAAMPVAQGQPGLALRQDTRP